MHVIPENWDIQPSRYLKYSAARCNKSAGAQGNFINVSFPLYKIGKKSDYHKLSSPEPSEPGKLNGFDFGPW